MESQNLLLVLQEGMRMGPRFISPHELIVERVEMDRGILCITTFFLEMRVCNTYIEGVEHH